MTRTLSYVLLADGGTDRALRHIIDWAIRMAVPSLIVEGFVFVKRDGPVGPAIERAIARYRPEILFVHRDAEAVALSERRNEIPAIDERVVRIVPVRMTEAWLLIDEAAIRMAAGNPNGRAPIDLPPIRRLESLPNPKRVLGEAMLAACDARRGRKRKRVSRRVAEWSERVAARIADFDSLHELPAFREFEAELRLRLEAWGGATTA